MNNDINEFDWDDIKVFLEIANTGSLTQAAVKLNKSQPTIGRRIEKLEKSLGVNLFKRSPYGYELTSVAESLLATAQCISEKIDLFLNEAKILQTDVTQDTVVITCGESFVALLTAHMHDFMLQHPEISLDIISSFEVINLDKGGADIAIRSQRPENPNLITRKLGTCHYAIYASHYYLEQHSAASEPLNAGSQLNWIAYKDDNAELHSSKWLATNIDSNNIKLRCNTPSSLLLSIKNHQGLAVLPQFVAQHDNELVQLSLLLDTLQPDIWLVLNRNAHRNRATTLVSQWISHVFELAGF